MKKVIKKKLKKSTTTTIEATMSNPIKKDAKWWNADLMETISLPHEVEEIKLILGNFGVRARTET